MFGVSALGAVRMVWFLQMIKEHAATDGESMVHGAKFWNAQLQLTLHEMVMLAFEGISGIRPNERAAMSGSRRWMVQVKLDGAFQMPAVTIPVL